MRGMYTAGVLDVFMENGILFDGMIGVSAGAVFGCNYKSRQIGRTIRYNKRFCKDKRYCSIRSLIKTGNIFNEEFCYHTVPDELDIFDRAAFAENPMEFYVVATDTQSGKAIYKKCDKGDDCDLEWFRASASMPMVSRPVKIDGGTYLDGGISDSIPLEYFKSIGYERNIVVLTRPDTYKKKKAAALPLARLMLRKHKGAYETLKRRHIEYNAFLERLSESKASGETLVIQPKRELDISHTERDPDELQRVYQTGRDDALEMLPQVLAFISAEKSI